MNIRLSAVIAFALLMVGCATNPNLSAAQKVDLKPYSKTVYDSCIAHHKQKDSYTDSTNIKCLSEAKYMIDSMKKTYFKYNEALLVERCDTSNQNVINQCLASSQNDYYLKTVESYIKEVYPLTK